MEHLSFVRLKVNAKAALMLSEYPRKGLIQYLMRKFAGTMKLNNILFRVTKRECVQYDTLYRSSVSYTFDL